MWSIFLWLFWVFACAMWLGTEPVTVGTVETVSVSMNSVRKLEKMELFVTTKRRWPSGPVDGQGQQARERPGSPLPASE